MNPPITSVRQSAHPMAFRLDALQDTSWSLVGTAGALFVALGGVDAALVWYPPAFGQPEWEFGSITASLNGLPLVVMGLVLGAAAAAKQHRVMLARVLAIVMAVLAVAILAAAVLYLSDVPMALRATRENAAALQGMRKSLVKTLTQLVCYPTGLLIMAWQLRGSTRSGT